MTRLKAALIAVATSPAVQKEAKILLRVAVAVVAARFGLDLKG